MHRSDEIRSQAGMRKLDNRHTKERKICWNIYRGCHRKQLRQENVMPEGQENGFTFEDGTG
jgi:hypothetical protein